MKLHGYTVQYFMRIQCNKLRCMRTKKIAPCSLNIILSY